MTMAATAPFERDAFMPRAPAGIGRALVLALIAHLLLVAALSFSTNWRISTPEGVEAELWAAVPQIAAPRAAEPEPPPEPPRPVPKTPPPPEPPKPQVREAPVPDAQIAIEKAKRLEDKRKLAEQAAADKLAKQRKAEAAEKLAEQKRKDEAAAAAKAKTDTAAKKREDAALAKAREAQMQRIASLAGATGATNATGTAMQSAGPSASYIGRIKGRIRPNVSFPDNLSGNPAVEIDIRLAPDGRIMSARIVKRSGVPEWDDAVLRAIDRTEVLPRDESGQVPPAMTIVYSLRE